MAARKAVVSVKRVYEEPSPSDGVRVLVDRLWPRGLKKEEVRMDAWLRDLAPSNELRKWFHRHPEEQQQFHKRYAQELRGAAAHEALSGLENLVKDEGKVTLLFASKNADYNNATVLREIMEAAPTRPQVRRPSSRSGISATKA